MSKRLRPLVLKAIKKTALDVATIAAELGVSRQTASTAIKQLYEAKRIHIERREGMQQKPFYIAGRGEDAPRKKTLRERIPEMIDSKAMTANEIAELAGVSRQVATAILSQLREAGEKIRIFDWKIQAHGPHLARYIVGDGEDAPRPEPMTNAEKVAKYRSTEKGKRTTARCRRRWRNSAAGKEYERKHWQKYWIRKKFAKQGVAGFDPLLAAIMGKGT